MEYINLTFENYEKIINNKDSIYLIDFHSNICEPCKMMVRTLEKVQEYFNDKLIYCKVDTDEEPKLSQFFESYCTPSIVIYKNNKILKYIPGLKSSKELIDIITTFLN